MEGELETDFRIPTATLQACVRCTDGKQLAGRLFVPASSSNHPGPMRPEERMNDSLEFFPFAADDGVTVFINKGHVVSVAVPFEALQHSGGESPEPLPVSGPAQRVVIECPGSDLRGELVIDMPEYKRRVLDYLNRPERFLSLRGADHLYLVNREQVLRVVELAEEQR